MLKSFIHKDLRGSKTRCLTFMTPEQKAAIAAAAKAEKDGKADKPEVKEEAETDEVAAEPIEGEVAAEVIEDDPSNLDYEAIAKAERERADRAEIALAGSAFKGRNAKRKEKDDVEEVDVSDDEELDKPVTRRELAQRDQRIEKSATRNIALSIARANTSTEAEAQAGLQFWDTRVIPTGNLEEDVLFALAGINRKRTVSKTVEVARALRSKETALHSTAVVHREQSPAGEPKISPQDAVAIKQSGMVWDGTKRLYKKPLGNGKKNFYFDPKTKRRWAE